MVAKVFQSVNDTFDEHLEKDLFLEELLILILLVIFLKKNGNEGFVCEEHQEKDGPFWKY